MDRSSWDRAVETRAVAPLVIAGTKRLVGPCTLVTNGVQTVAFTSSELLRAVANDELAIVTRLDGSEVVAVASWGAGSYTGLGLCALATFGSTADVTPIAMGSVCATVDGRGAPSALVTIAQAGRGFARVVVPVYVDRIGEASDALARLASPLEVADESIGVEGATLFTWFPAEPALGRKSQVLAMAIAYQYRAGTFRPRPTAAVGELLGLDDLARALPDTRDQAEPELGQVAGEIRDAKP